MDLAIQAYDSPHTKAFLLLQAAGLGVAMGKTEHGDFDHPSYPKVSKDGVLELQYDGKHINIYLNTQEFGSVSGNCMKIITSCLGPRFRWRVFDLC